MDKDIDQTTTTDLTTGVDSFSVPTALVDSVGKPGVTTWSNDKYGINLGYYKSIPEFKKAVDALATWTCGKGWVADNGTTVILGKISGNGKQSFQIIMESHMMDKKVNGDAYTHIVRNEDTGTLINLKRLNPSRMKTYFSADGLITHYEQTDVKRNNSIKTFKPEDRIECGTAVPLT